MEWMGMDWVAINNAKEEDISDKVNGERARPGRMRIGKGIRANQGGQTKASSTVDVGQ